MFDQIISGIQEQIRSGAGNLNLPEGVSSEAFASAAGSSVLDNLKSAAGQGDLSGIMEMFSGQVTGGDSQAISNLAPGVVNGIAEKLGIDPSAIQGSVEQFMPQIMNMFNDQVNSGGNGFDIGNIISQFTGGEGGSGGGIGDLINQFAGGKTGEGGGLGDLFRKLF